MSALPVATDVAITAGSSVALATALWQSQAGRDIGAFFEQAWTDISTVLLSVWHWVRPRRRRRPRARMLAMRKLSIEQMEAECLPSCGATTIAVMAYRARSDVHPLRCQCECLDCLPPEGIEYKRGVCAIGGIVQIDGKGEPVYAHQPASMVGTVDAMHKLVEAIGPAMASMTVDGITITGYPHTPSPEAEFSQRIDRIEQSLHECRLAVDDRHTRT